MRAQPSTGWSWELGVRGKCNNNVGQCTGTGDEERRGGAGSIKHKYAELKCNLYLLTLS